MNSDFAFSIGKSHDICQDYATDYSPYGGHQIIVCDGCSSSVMTDVGARVLALTMAQVISKFDGENFDAIKNIGARRFDNAMSSLLDMFSPSADPKQQTIYDATLLAAKVCEGRVFIMVVGDGCIVLTYRNGQKEVVDISTRTGYPLYMSYYIFDSRMASFRELDDGVKVFTYRYGDDGVLENSERTEESKPLLFSYDCGELTALSLMSDGVHSFKEESESVVPHLIIDGLTSFKGYKGRFVQRRMNRFEKDCAKRGWYHLDDVSIATLHFEEEDGKHE